MHEESPMIEATRRDRLGSRYAKRVRAAGKLPAIVYGHGEEPVPVSIDAKQANTLFHKGEKVFQMKFDGSGEAQYVLLKELQFDYLGTNIVHADFARVNLDERVEVSVPVVLVGEAKGLRKANTLLLHPTSELELECTVTNIPDRIEVDVSQLDLHDMIRAKDVTLPRDTMVLLTDGEAILAEVVESRAEAESGEEETVGAGEAEPKVIEREKKEKEEQGD